MDGLDYRGPNLVSSFVTFPGQHNSSLFLLLHKSQGQTLDRAVISLGKKENVPGCTFVAISRLRRLEDCLIQPMTLQRLLAIGKAKSFQARLAEDRRLAILEGTTPVSFRQYSSVTNYCQGQYSTGEIC